MKIFPSPILLSFLWASLLSYTHAVDYVASQGGNITNTEEVMILLKLSPEVVEAAVNITSTFADSGFTTFGYSHIGITNKLYVHGFCGGNGSLSDASESDIQYIGALDGAICNTASFCDPQLALATSVAFDCTNVADAECKKDCESTSTNSATLPTCAGGTAAEDTKESSASDETSGTNSGSGSSASTSKTVTGAFTTFLLVTGSIAFTTIII